MYEHVKPQHYNYDPDSETSKKQGSGVMSYFSGVR